jgi:TatD DNase family protein
MLWIDTHCHLDAAEFDADRASVAQRAQAAGVARIVLPAVTRNNFARVRELAAQIDGAYALGIHPLFTATAAEEDLVVLRTQVTAALDDPRFVGIGEIGLDYFVQSAPPDVARQHAFFDAQLKIARDFALPVLCHVRKAQDPVLKSLRRYGVTKGIAHAFNGSFQQAHAYLRQGLKLGFGGAATFPRALQIRRLFQQLPLDALVLETDAPDLAPVWQHPGRNEPHHLPKIGTALAGLRGLPPEQLALCTTENAYAALPRLRQSGSMDKKS